MHRISIILALAIFGAVTVSHVYADAPQPVTNPLRLTPVQRANQEADNLNILAASCFGSGSFIRTRMDRTLTAKEAQIFLLGSLAAMLPPDQSGGIDPVVAASAADKIHAIYVELSANCNRIDGPTIYVPTYRQ